MKQSLVIKEIHGEVVETIPKNSLKLAKKFVKEQKIKLTPHEKEITKFRIIPKK
jgi:hypothetical protein